jgi:transcriptional regulator with XRE-family HTH domain
MVDLNAHVRLREWMDRSRLSQTVLCGRLGISDAHMSRLLSGERTPSLALAGKIADLTGIPATAWIKAEGVNA